LFPVASLRETCLPEAELILRQAQDDGMFFPLVPKFHLGTLLPSNSIAEPDVTVEEGLSAK